MADFQKRFFLILSILLILQAGANFIKYSLEEGRFGGDFVSFWAAAQNVAHDNIAVLYNTEKLKAYLKSYDTPSTTLAPPIIYPPHILLLLRPLGNLTYNQAVAAWSFIPLLLYSLLVFLGLKRSGLSKDNTSSNRLAYIVVCAALLPLLSANLFCGETGAFIAVLFLTMAYCWNRYPVLAGICIGLMTVKPQLGLLIPFALIASGSWYVFVVAACTAIVMFIASAAWLGASVWVNYIHMTQVYSGLLIKGSHNFDKLAVGPYISLHGAGVPANIAALLQILISISVLAVTVKVFHNRNNGGQDWRFALLACGTLLAAPNTMCYDTPLLAAALLPFITRTWRQGLNSPLEIIALTSIVVMPYAQLLLMPLHVPFSLFSLLLFFAVLYRRYNDEAAQPMLEQKQA